MMRSSFRSIFSSNLRHNTLSTSRASFPVCVQTFAFSTNSRLSTSTGLFTTQLSNSKFEKPLILTQKRNMVSDEELSKMIENDDLTQQSKQITLPTKEIIKILNAFRNVTNNQPFAGKLEALGKKKEIDLITKWQMMVQLLVQAKQAVVVKHGLKDVEEFKFALGESLNSRESSEILDLHRANWDDWISKVFPTENIDFTKDPPVPKTKMLRIIDRLLEQITGKEFTDEVGTMLKNTSLSLPEKGRDLIRMVSNTHQEIMEKYGFKGEKGYVECQRSLVVHFFADPDISKVSKDVSKVVFNYTTRMIKPKEDVY